MTDPTAETQLDPEVLLAQLEEALHENQALRQRALALNVELRRVRSHLDQLESSQPTQNDASGEVAPE